MSKVDEVASALLKRYVDIYEDDASKLPEFIDKLRSILNNGSAGSILGLLDDGIATSRDKTTFLEQFKHLNPNMDVLDEISYQLNLEVVLKPSNALVSGIKEALEALEGWAPYPDNEGGNFQEALQQYAEYYQTCTPEQQEKLTEVFWSQIQKLGTPVIESIPDNPSECNVYFLLPKGKIAESVEVPGTKKDLYLQGDFHGYDTTDGRQRVEEFEGTGIMLMRSDMPQDAIVTYRFVQLEQSLRGRTPAQHHGSELLPENFFPAADEEATSQQSPPAQTENASDQFWGASNQLNDDYSRHRQPVLGIGDPERVFQVNAEPSRAMISTDKGLNCSERFPVSQWREASRHFVHHDTLYSDGEGKLQHCEGDVKLDAPPGDLFSDAEDSPYANFTRAVHVFKPSSGVIDQVVVVNDGMPYLSSGAMEHFEKMVSEGNLSPNTAFVFVTPLPGLAKTISVDDPKANLPGMGVRTIDYEHGVEQYSDFIANELLPGLARDGLTLPQEAEHRVMIGSSLSGTASIYIALTHPELFGTVIAQSPAPSNRAILKDAISEEVSPTRPAIHLSCGVFEQPDYAANPNLPYARELSSRLNVPLEEGMHGHLFLAWAEDLEQSLPETMRSLQAQQIDSALG